MSRVLYLHGFASSSRSSKAGFFRQRLEAHDVQVECPDFNQPDFRSLTVTRMLGQVKERLSAAGGKAILIGSSLGGALAILAAERFAAQVDRLVLLAPAVMFAKPGHPLLPPERVERWQREGQTAFFHYGLGREEPLNYAFYDDSLQYDPFSATVVQPALVFQGRHDSSVDYRTVEAFARTRANVTLSLLDDDHQLIASLPRMWSGIQHFLELA